MGPRKQPPLYEPLAVRPVSPMFPEIDIDADLPSDHESKAMYDTNMPLSDKDTTEQATPPEAREYELQNMLRSHPPFPTSEFPTTPLETKTQRFISAFLIAVAALGFLIFSIYYSYLALVSETTMPSNLALAPGKTVLVINVLSHVVAVLCQLLYSNASEALRWALACSDHGVQLTTFLSLSRATPFIGVLYLSFWEGKHQLWSIIRLLAIAFVAMTGLVLITDVTFKNVYIPLNQSISAMNSIPVIAGTGVFNISYAKQGFASIINLFATAYTMGFMTDPRFVISVPPIGCSGAVGNCSYMTSVFLPGSLDLVRLDNGELNATLFSDALPGDTVVINQAPGYQIEYSTVDSSFEFREEDCALVMKSMGDGLHICITNSGYQMIIGWSICPSSLYKISQCTTNTTWTKNLDWNTTVNIYKRYATTAYDNRNLSILSIDAMSPPIAAPVDATQFKELYAIVLSDIPDLGNLSYKDVLLNSALPYTQQFGLGWTLRTYQDLYSTYHDGGLSLLRSYITVPLQFSTQVNQIIGNPEIADDMRVTATLAVISYRARAQSWTVWVFGALGLVLMLWSVGCLAWIYIWGPDTPNASFFPEVDVTSKSTFPRTKFGHDNSQLEAEVDDLAWLTRANGLGNGMSRDAVKLLSGRKIYCGSYVLRNNEKVVMLVTENEGLGKMRHGEKYL